MRVLVLLLAASLAGCVAPADDVVVPVQVDNVPLIGGLDGRVVAGHPMTFDAVCDGLCNVDWEGELPEDATYAFTVHWDGTQTTVTRPASVAEGVWQTGFDSMRLLTKLAGASVHADGTIWGTVSVLGPEVMALDGDPMLPNIVTYAPVQLGVDRCDWYEESEQGAQRCLRLGNAIGNTGDGPLQVALPPEQGVLAAADLGSFDQVIPLRSGGEERHPVGNADIHLTHGHFHYDGFARFSLYHWDPETGLRGALAAEHKKSGFCFLDWGEMEDPDRAPAEGGRADTDCLVPGTSGWTMGVSAGWFDFYWAGLTDQYIDIAGVSDGTYELVSTADWSDSLLETNEWDNSASAIVELRGDDVTVLETRSFYTLPEDTRQL